jgi:hypothetical protein
MSTELEHLGILITTIFKKVYKNVGKDEVFGFFDNHERTFVFMFV